MAEGLQHATRKNDIVARSGGDEFVFIALVSEGSDTKLFAKRIIDYLADPLIFKEHEYHIKVSIDISITSPSESDFDALLVKADEKMYQAKRNGKNTWVI